MLVCWRTLVCVCVCVCGETERSREPQSRRLTVLPSKATPWPIDRQSRPIYRVLQTTFIKGPPFSIRHRLPPPLLAATLSLDLFTVPRASLRPHSHDPRCRATFGTTSLSLSLSLSLFVGEGFSLRVVGGRSGWYRGWLCSGIVAASKYRRTMCTRERGMHTRPIAGRRSLLIAPRPGAESSSVRLTGTARHGTASHALLASSSSSSSSAFASWSFSSSSSSHRRVDRSTRHGRVRSLQLFPSASPGETLRFIIRILPRSLPVSENF